ncbi:MAG: biotin/lipoyl-binding protein [Pseudonocardiaceae bacterium]
MILTSSSELAPARRSGGRALVAFGLVTLLSAAAVGCGSEPAPPPTGRVERGTVVNMVSASGSLSAIREQDLGFPMNGQLKQVMIKVGDRVTPGQVLAREDDFLLRQTLNQLQGQLNSQQAILGQAVNATTVMGDQASLEQARQVVGATQQSVDAELVADAAAAERAHKQVDLDGYQADKVREQLRADQVSCAASGGIPYTPPAPTNGSNGNSSGPNSSVGVGPGQARVDNPVKVGPVSAGVTAPGPAGSAVGGNGNGNPACNNIAQDQANATAARQQLFMDKTTLVAAQQKQNVDRTQGEVSVQTALQNVITAQNSLQSDSTNRPFNIDQQAGLVSDLAAQVANAQRNVDNTVLYAPVGGTVSVINGAVGEYVQASSGTTPLAPGVVAPIPGLNGSTASSSSSLGNPSTGAARPGGTQFIVLNNVNSFQVIVPFEESDASKVAPNQKATVTFDALPDLSRTGTVLAVSPSGSSISSVINYYVTIVLGETDPRLKDGQTAEARVVTNEVDDVLTVPNSSIRKSGDQRTVTVIDANGAQQQVRFQAGLVGDTRTQVISGLREGQEVILRGGV